MAKLSILAGSTSQTVNLFIQDSSSTTGAGLTGLAYNAASLTAYYALPRAASVAITLATLAAVTSSYSSGGFKEIDATNMPGWYRFDVPDAAIASGRFVAIHLKGATNMAPLPLEIELTAWNNQDGVRGGMTAFPNVASGSAGAIITSGTGTAQLSVASGVAQADAAKVGGQTASAAATVTFPGTIASTTNITAGTITTATNLTNAPTAGDFTATMKTSLNAATPASVAGAVGSVTGSVGSVVGAVGSVTGNVGGNVTGSVGSLATQAKADVTAAVPTAVQNADGLLKRDWTSVSGEANYSALNALRPLRNKVTVGASTLTVYKEDGTTTAFTETVTKDATANPIIGVTPA